jgi:hypothetical protein
MLQVKSIRSSLPALALGACLALPVSAIAQAQFARECSAKDISVLTLIEEHGEAGDVSGNRLAAAHLTMLDARTACSEGRVGEALALYQSVFELGPAHRAVRNSVHDTTQR